MQVFRTWNNKQLINQAALSPWVEYAVEQDSAVKCLFFLSLSNDFRVKAENSAWP